MENYVVYVDSQGFFESMGHNGITFTDEINKAFQTSVKRARDIMKSFNGNGCVLKVCI